MRIGLFAGTTADTHFDLKALVAFAREAERRGFDSLWLPNIFGMDGVGACAIAGFGDGAQADCRLRTAD